MAPVTQRQQQQPRHICTVLHPSLCHFYSDPTENDVDSRFDAVDEHPSQQESDGAQDHDGGAHDCCSSGKLGASTKTKLRTSSEGTLYHRALRVSQIRISANLSQCESRGGVEAVNTC